MTNLLNLLFYQIGWLACVLGAAAGFQWPGIFVALCLVGAHLWLATNRGLQAWLMISASVVGLVVDTAQLWAGVFAFPSGTVVPGLPPPFMVVLWMQFATTFRYSMKWLSGRYLRCAVFGFLGAPVAFFAGERLGAIELLAPRLLHFATLGVIWSACVPLLFLVSDRLASRWKSPDDYRLLNSRRSGK